MGRYARYFDPEAVSDLAFNIIRAGGEVPSGDGVSLTELCILLDWMHEHIAYELDSVQYGREEYIATPQETLSSKRGDCEDHALLFGSFCLALGAKVRFAMVPGHAFAEICLGPSSGFDGKAAVREIRRYIERRSRSFGLAFGDVPFSQGKLAEGWTRDAAGGYIRNPRRYGAYSRKFHRVQWNVIDGEVYIPVDDCYCMMYPGDVARMTEFMGGGGGGLWREVDYELALPTRAPRPSAAASALDEPSARLPRLPRAPTRRPRPPRERNGRRYLGAVLTIIGGLLVAGHVAGELPTAIDGAAGCFVLWSAWRGYQLGFFEQAIMLAAWALPVALSLWLIDWADGLYLEHVTLELPYRKALIMVALFGASALLMRGLRSALDNGQRSARADQPLGALFGAAMAAVVVALVLSLWGLFGAELGSEPDFGDSIAARYAQGYDLLKSEHFTQALELPLESVDDSD